MSCSAHVTVAHRALRLSVSFFFAVGLLLATTTAWAGSDEKIRVEFMGFGANPDFYSVIHKDKLAGNTLAVYQIGSPQAVASVTLEGRSAKSALKSPQIAPYKIQTSGHTTGAKAPSGAYQLFGTQVGAQFQIGLTDGSAQSTLGYLPVPTDPNNTEFAKTSVKSVHWSADGSRVVIILNQKLGGEWPMDTDTLAAYALQAPSDGEGEEGEKGGKKSGKK